MEAQFDNSRIFPQILHTLLHFASVQVAFLLIKEFGYETLMKAFERIQEGTLIGSDEISEDPKYKVRLLKCERDWLKWKIQLLSRKKSAGLEKELEFRKLEKRKRKMTEYCKTNSLMKEYRAQEMIRHYIPQCLRPKVIEAVEGIKIGPLDWSFFHFDSVETLEGISDCYWKSDGTFDGIETARQLVLNASIDLLKRFRVACTYCFEELIPTLWSELNASGQMDDSLFFYHSMMAFWVRRLLDETRDMPWTQQFGDDLRELPHLMRGNRIFFSSVFPLLQPQEREQFLNILIQAQTEDFWLCTQVMTGQEEMYVLKNYPYKLLLCYLKWPLRNKFLEIAEKIWDYLHYYDFDRVALRLVSIQEHEQADISELFAVFWKKIPKHWRKEIKNTSLRREKIKSWLKEIRQ